MNIDKELNDLKELHEVGYKGLLCNKTYIWKLINDKTTYVSILLSILIFCPFIFFSINSYLLLNKVIALSISIFPSLLGFCIGGYAIIIGFGDRNIIKSMSDPLSNRGNLSFFQIVNGTFALSILIQIITLFFSFVISLFIAMNFEASSQVIMNNTNYTLSFFVIFLSIFSLFLICDTVINIFNFAQMVHFKIRLDKIMDDNRKTKKE